MTGQGWEGGLGLQPVRAPHPHPSAREKEDQEIQKQRRGGPSLAPPRARPLCQACPSREAKGPRCHGASLWGGGLFKQPRKGGQATFHREPPDASQNLMAPAHPNPLVLPARGLSPLSKVLGANPPHLPSQRPKGPLPKHLPGQDWGPRASSHTEVKGPRGKGRKTCVLTGPAPGG